ncbi:uncharacterized protein F5Z01DRAFT_624297 [Emericellopsis atlantica]|uniref:2-oxoadipate dioxygenase/decarboxylase n=1 Tax=Emericellopsis atlantica TaxID=2614577 RepID=A0A9P8CNN4_9HYPO|nr:uncharacterized protein F5Z01DRAFT_624297 [Emericellopsis atlantica]KAG9253317.1 hypothetical protein F5Z01DRAFT_624297 [Emericellopsis atlantica]
MSSTTTQTETQIRTLNVDHTWADPDALRGRFAAAMSAMYREEVPLYGDLMGLVRDVNDEALNRGTSQTNTRSSPESLAAERHGAIRLGTPFELQTVRRIFSVLGMYPVGYYDLSVAGLPMHATCFRPTQVQSLDVNPFRVFTTLLRPDLIQRDEARTLAWKMLQNRKIFTDALLALLDVADAQQGRLDEDQAAVFIPQALQTFSWQHLAASTYKEYQILRAEHPILADIACFRTAHINHLTPRTLDISAMQIAMKEAGMNVKSRIEGPPARKCPILLRQTSFLALEESVQFLKDGNARDSPSPDESELIQATHKARFGETEERGAAVTAKGRQLYDKLLSESMSRTVGLSVQAADAVSREIFRRFPDDWSELRQQGLIYCEFSLARKPAETPVSKRDEKMSLLEQLIDDGIVTFRPITYEDFLPFSAAGIFQSNLQSQKGLDLKPPVSDFEGLVKALGVKPMDMEDWYAQAQRQSLELVGRELGFGEQEWWS